jgi:hypothetical protein
MRMVILAVLCALPNLARADQMRVTSYDMDDVGGVVRLESDATVGEPWVRVDAHAVRVWFPHVVDIARFDHEREAGQPIRALALRPGANDTAVLRIDLGTARHVKQSDVEVTRNGLQATVQVHVPKQLPVADPATQAPLGIDQPSALANNATKAATPAAAAPAVQPTAASATALQPTLPTDLPLGKALSGAAPAELSKEQPPTLLYLLVATVVLSVVLGGLQFMNKRKPSVKPQIEVLGARRLGHRQELLIVRALGSDHLLLCTGGRAERVASSPTPVPQALAAENPARGEDSQAGGLNLISRLSSHHRMRKLLDSVDNDNADDVVDPMPLTKPNPFGAELFSAARKQAAVHSLPAGRTRQQSEAVAGIDRLRKRAAT